MPSCPSHLDCVPLIILQDAVDACHEYRVNHQLTLQRTAPAGRQHHGVITGLRQLART